jgi:hypothetical protein
MGVSITVELIPDYKRSVTDKDYRVLKTKNILTSPQLTAGELATYVDSDEIDVIVVVPRR